FTIAAIGTVGHLVCTLYFDTPADHENTACALLCLMQLDDLRTTIDDSAISILVALLGNEGGLN
ncbi:hypothetical protein BHE74_00043561, partial [Ensete ventricosum]